jgi:hypothetical protein
LVSLVLVTCDHPFPDPTPRGETSDRDPDGAVSDHRPGPDRRPAERGTADRALTDACTTTAPPGAPAAGACETLSGWVCLGACEGVDHLVCFQGTTVKRKLSCDANGDCMCHDGGKTTPCVGLPATGRTGCARGKEAFDNGCCK